ncbi:helix-turn-helix domain-containing protein [Marinicellulosiphila megalodicopiae]|uniref:helix-turn-helix domain-containing protein n=1 Tax=Marinicellulosiphila megalodicopiae TaxID=2724896 RepID=UPI003BB00EB8
MILAEKIVKLRKHNSWSQEELADKMSVSRQSVSKWESTNSIPDLNKIILLAKLFDVSTDSLLKDEIETFDDGAPHNETSAIQISLEQAAKYIEHKMAVSALTIKGVLLCVCSVIPLFFFLAMAHTQRLNLTGNIATAIGIMGMLIMISIAVSFFIKINQYENDISQIDNDPFELAYGVHSVFKEKLQQYRPTYNLRLSIGIFLFITCFAPLMFVSVFFKGTDIVLMMLNVLMLMIAVGLYLVIPASAKMDAFNNILKDTTQDTPKSKRTKRAEKLAAFYWPLLTTVYLGWSLWTMNWGFTWIIWPVGAVLFVALVGLMELLEKDEG